MTLEIILGIVLAGLLSNNYPLLHFLGTGAVLENERSNRRSLVLGLGTTVVMLLSTLITWPINKFLLHNVSYLQTLVFVCVVLVVVEVFHVIEHNVIEKFCKVDFTKFAINGAVLGLCIHNAELGLVEALITSIGVGLGFTVILAVYSALEFRMDYDAIPYSFRGLPIHLLIAGMITLALLCF
ncbi:MAG: hypothetical protein J6S23_05670 [Clostridia bacterium]|nr:hypothetical protein [Clostridia bacterium]